MQHVSKRALVAEDNFALAHVLQFNLERSGFEVTVAHDGGEAWEYVQREKFDVVITDHEMPRMTGLELCARLRDLPDYEITPVVMVTARGLELDTVRIGQRLRVAAIIPKPYSPSALLSTVEKLLAAEATRSP
ncbi:MAG: response regulator [Pirellulales bacterium]